jgi:hypothetical protein
MFVQPPEVQFYYGDGRGINGQYVCAIPQITLLRCDVIPIDQRRRHCRIGYKGLENLDKLRQKLVGITDRFVGFEAQSLNVHVDFPLFQKLALPVISGKTRIAGIKIHDTRMIRRLAGHLKEEVTTTEELEQQAGTGTDTQAAEEMQKAKERLWHLLAARQRGLIKKVDS